LKSFQNNEWKINRHVFGGDTLLSSTNGGIHMSIIYVKIIQSAVIATRRRIGATSTSTSTSAAAAAAAAVVSNPVTFEYFSAQLLFNYTK
jgi:hypothetical protein